MIDRVFKRMGGSVYGWRIFIAWIWASQVIDRRINVWRWFIEESYQDWCELWLNSRKMKRENGGRNIGGSPKGGQPPSARELASRGLVLCGAVWEKQRAYLINFNLKVGNMPPKRVAAVGQPVYVQLNDPSLDGHRKTVFTFVILIMLTRMDVPFGLKVV